MHPRPTPPPSPEPGRGRPVRRDTSALREQVREKIKAYPGTITYLDSYWPPELENDVFPVDPEQTRMFAWFAGAPSDYGNEMQRINLVHDYMDKGLIPITMDPVMFKEAQDRLRSEAGSTPDNRATAPDESPSHNRQIIIKPSSIKRSGQRSRSSGVNRVSKPEQSLPEHLQPKGDGIE